MLSPSIFAALDAEWASLTATPAAAAGLAGWRDTDPAIQPYATFADLVGAVERRDVTVADQVLSALIRRACDDSLAARTVLQLLLPGAKALCRRVWWISDYDDQAAAVLAALWERIRTYPWARRPARIAPNVLRDVTQRLLRDAVRRRPDEVLLDAQVAGFLLRAGADAEPGADPPATAELLELLGHAVRRGCLSAADARLIALTRIADVPIEALAAQARLGTHSMRRRRQRAERRLAAAAAELGLVGTTTTYTSDTAARAAAWAGRVATARCA